MSRPYFVLSHRTSYSRTLAARWFGCNLSSSAYVYQYVFLTHIQHKKLAFFESLMQSHCEADSNHRLKRQLQLELAAAHFEQFYRHQYTSPCLTIQHANVYRRLTYTV